MLRSARLGSIARGVDRNLSYPESATRKQYQHLPICRVVAKPPNDPNQAADRASCGAISGNIGSYAADSMVNRCGPPPPPPARAADSDTLDPGTVRPSVPVYDKPVFLPRP